MQEYTTHVQMACCMAGVHDSRHTTPYMSINMTRDTCAATPRAPTCQAACAASMYGETSSF
ncbi:hypothetical protein DY000_02014025 [Brassica cretica]|uniref:Uncharacterized protein n=1 Tax=Brassica cretica TaxID=69181 RepID=A0ABQ7CYU3_BRACR|nr:hypothetical protein DY000_02014025 [Brassica cretica]